MKILYPSAFIYAVEPIPIIFDCLTKNHMNEKNVLLFNIAISQKTRKVSMEFKQGTNSQSSQLYT